MRRMLTPSVVLLAGLILGLTGCSGESPTSPTGPGGGSGNGNCNVTISLNATSVTPLAGSAVIVRATVKKGGVAVPDGSSVVFTTDYGTFQETGLPSVSKVTSSGFADVTLTAGASGTSHLKATVDCGSATLAVEFGAIPADGPYISSMTPLTGSCLGGDTVTINGGRFMTSLNVQPRVTFGGVQATVVSATANLIVVLTPSRILADASVPETVDVVVTVNPGTAAIQTTSPKKFTYTCLNKRIAISSVNPNTGRQEGNEPVVISGANFLPTSSSGPATTRVTFGGVPASIVSQTDTTLNVTTPRHMLANPAVPETVDVVVTVDLGLPTQQSASLLHAYTYYASGTGAPCNSDPRLYITQVTVTTPTASPGSPDGGDVVTISGFGFWFSNTTQPQPMNRLKVEFGGVQAVVQTWTDSSIVAVAPRFTLTNPDAPQSVEVKVTVDVGGFREACATVARGYTYFPGSFADIYITSMSPSTGPNDASTRVTIFGKNFRFPSQVFVSGGTIVNAEATVVSITSTQIVFMTPLASGANAGLAGTRATIAVRDTYSSKTVTTDPIKFQYYACPTAGTASPATSAWNVSTPVTISGNAFEEPVNAVFVAPGGQTLQLNVISVSSSFIVIQMPTLDQFLGTGNLAPCADVNGIISLTFPSLACVSAPISVPFIYQINRPTISTVSPPTIPQNPGSLTVSVTGSNFVDPMTVEILKDATVVATVNNAVVSSTSSLTFLAPPMKDSDFNTNPCSVSGTQRVPTSFGVRLTNRRTGCTATLPNALIYTPADTTCSSKLLLPAASLPDASLCTSYSSYTFVASGGVGALFWSATGLPAGMTLSLAGVLSGTPRLTANGPGQASTLVPINVTVTDSSPTPQTVTRAFQLTLLDPAAPLALSGTTSQNIPAAGGTTSAFTASPNPTPSTFTPMNWSIASIVPNPAPGLITLTSSTGQTNTLTVAATLPAGTYTVNLQVTDSACGTFKHQSVILPVTIVKAVPAGPTITSAAAVNATICTALNFPFAATGGTGPTYTWAVSSGSLPSGFVLSPGGVLSGTPQLTTTTSPYPFTSSSSFSVTVSDSAVPPLTATQVVTLTVTDPMAPFNILGPTNIAVPAAGGETNAVGSPALPFTVNPPPVAGFIPVTWTVGVATGVPPTVNPPAGSFSITDPTRTNQSIFVSPALAAGTYEMTLTAVDNTCGTLKHKADLVVRITKLPAPPAALASGYAGGLPNGTVCKVYSKAPTTTGGTGTYSYSLVASTLPQGLSLDPTTGVVSGAPAILATGPGTPSQSYTVTIRVTDSAVPTPQTVTNTYTFSVADPAALFALIGPTPVAPSASALVPTNYTYNLSLPSVPENLPYTWSIPSVMAVGAAPPAPAGAFTLTPSGVSNSPSAILTVAGGGVLASPNSYDVTIQIRDSGCAGAGNYHVNTIVVRVNVAP